MTSREHRRPRARFQEAAEERDALEQAMASFQPPPGWRVLWSDYRVEAEWTSGTSWARYSMRFHRPGELDTADEVFFRCCSGSGTLTVTFVSSDLLPSTIAAAADMLSPLQLLMASARVSSPDDD
jgi:hypothetical protein